MGNWDYSHPVREGHKFNLIRFFAIKKVRFFTAGDLIGKNWSEMEVIFVFFHSLGEDTSEKIASDSTSEISPNPKLYSAISEHLIWSKKDLGRIFQKMSSQFTVYCSFNIKCNLFRLKNYWKMEINNLWCENW